MSKIMNGSLSRKDGKLLLGWERVGGWWWGDDLACPGIPSKGE